MKVEEITKRLANLNISESKMEELKKSKKMVDNFNKILEYETNPENKLFYALASTMQKKIKSENLEKIIHAIKNKEIITDKELARAYYLLDNDKPIKFRFKTEEELREFLTTNKMTENKARAIILKECEYNLPAKETMEIISELCKKEDKNLKVSIFEKGELRKLHTPQTNYQKTPEILKAHLKETGGIYITRFPPEPNGCLHIGHAKSLFLNFGYAKHHKGKCIIRFDDTNPKNEKKEYYESIVESIKWMGYPTDIVTAASDHFELLEEYGEELIKRGKAYICHQTPEEIKDFRERFEMSPYRERPMEESLKIFKDMRHGKVKPGKATLRLKQPNRKENPLTLDLVAFRVIDENIKHHKNSRAIYPTYDYTHCLNDSIENITHSFCSREFMIRRETYYWLIDALDLYRPVQWEFSRLNISQTVLSKRKLTRLVDEKIVDGWDDPRLFTLIGLKRRGVTPAAINKFVEDVGYTFNLTIIDVKKFENHIRNDLYENCKKTLMVVKNPIEAVLNFGENKTRTVFIEKGDFKGCSTCSRTCGCEIDENFLRLSRKSPVRLNGLEIFEFERINENGALVLNKTGEENNNLKTIHWVDKENSENIKLFMYDHLFNSFNPEEVDMMSDINPNSLVVLENAVVDKSEKISELKEESLQFMRIGFFKFDEKNGGFNLTISLKK